VTENERDRTPRMRVDLDRDGWRSATNDIAGVVADLAALYPDLLARFALIPTGIARDGPARSRNSWSGWRTTRRGTEARSGWARAGRVSV